MRSMVQYPARRGGGKVPDDRMIDGMDMRDFLLGDPEESGRDTVLCLQGKAPSGQVASVEGRACSRRTRSCPHGRRTTLPRLY